MKNGRAKLRLSRGRRANPAWPEPRPYPEPRLLHLLLNVSENSSFCLFIKTKLRS